MKVEWVDFIGMGKKVSYGNKVKIIDASENLHLATENTQYVPIMPEGMVDIAIRELGAKIVKVELLEAEEPAEINNLDHLTS